MNIPEVMKGVDQQMNARGQVEAEDLIGDEGVDEGDDDGGEDEPVQKKKRGGKKSVQSVGVPGVSRGEVVVVGSGGSAVSRGGSSASAGPAPRANPVIQRYEPYASSGRGGFVDVEVPPAEEEELFVAWINRSDRSVELAELVGFMLEKLDNVREINDHDLRLSEALVLVTGVCDVDDGDGVDVGGGKKASTQTLTERDLKGLPRGEQDQFREAKKKEWSSMIEKGAIRVLSARESAYARRMLGDRIMRGRFVLTKKPVEDAKEGDQNWKPKARWVICGFTDPDLLVLPRAAPVASTLSLHLVLLLCLQHRFKLSIADISTAYLNSPQRTRESGQVFVTLKGVPEVDPQAVGEIMKPVYGTVDGGHAWFVTLRNFLVEDLDMKQMGLCIQVYTKWEGGILIGVIAVVVDDLIILSSPAFEKYKARLRSQYTFGT